MSHEADAEHGIDKSDNDFSRDHSNSHVDNFVPALYEWAQLRRDFVVIEDSMLQCIVHNLDIFCEWMYGNTFIKMILFLMDFKSPSSLRGCHLWNLVMLLHWEIENFVVEGSIQQMELLQCKLCWIQLTNGLGAPHIASALLCFPFLEVFHTVYLYPQRKFT